MNHISTLTVTEQYIRNQVQKVTQKNTDDILEVISAVMAAIDERFQAHESHMKEVQKQLKLISPEEKQL